ncbi:MAG: chemotaxis response regulator protein-glutamate methylesterase [Eubacteriales bacterium]
MKKILLVDDSALMRRVLCDIIADDGRYVVEGQAKDGKEALELILANTYDVVILDVHMPRMNGIELLRELKERRIRVKVFMVSSLTTEGASVTMEALELGAMDFVTKPGSFLLAKSQTFQPEFLRVLEAVASGKVVNRNRISSKIADQRVPSRPSYTPTRTTQVSKQATSTAYKKPVKVGPNETYEVVVAIASSTGGPKALQVALKSIPASIQAPILIVQHMPIGFTQTFAQRLDSMCEISVKEAEEGDVLEKGCAYLARGGMHMNVVLRNGVHMIHYSDEPQREGVKPCANYMYESLGNSKYKRVVCVVLTGMGSDGTKGILELNNHKKIEIIAQDEESCVVYGMPKSITKTGLVQQNYSIERVGNQIIKNVGVR